DVNGDGVSDTIVSVSLGPPHVKVLDGKTGTEIASFYAFDPRFLGGANVAVSDVNGDGVDDVIVGTASQFSHVKVIDGTKLNLVKSTGAIDDSALLASFMAFPGYAGGVTVGGGDVNGDGFADVIVGTSRELGQVAVFD